MLGTVAPVVALLTILAVVGAYGYTRLTQTLVEQRDAELVQLAARQITDHWADTVLLLTQMATTDAARHNDVAAVQELLDSNLALRQRFDQISVSDVSGAIVANVGGTVRAQIGSSDYFQMARRLRRPVRSRAHFDEAGQLSITVAVPMFDWAGRFSGCMLGVWSLRGGRLGLPVSNLRVGPNGFAFLVDEAGTILYHPEDEMLGADAHEHPAVAALLRGETGAQTLGDGGSITVVGYTPLSLGKLSSSLLADRSWEGWGLLTSESWNDLLAPLQPYARLMFMLLVLLITLPLLVLAINSRRIVAPLQRLATQVGRVASGEFDTQVSIDTGPSEIRELGKAFNQMVDQLREYRSDIQSYVVSILNTQEQERKRVARELHDDTAQALVVLGRRIEIVQEHTMNAELSDELEAVRDMVDDSLQSVRRFTRDLRPPLLEELGLPRTLEILGDRLDREETFRVNVYIMGEIRPLLPEMELGLYRLAQESLSNVRRHANASVVEVNFWYEPDQVILEVSDDGIGFEVPADQSELMRSGRLGLMGIHERARLFGGSAQISSQVGRGTTVRVGIPLSSIVLPRPNHSGSAPPTTRGT